MYPIKRVQFTKAIKENYFGGESASENILFAPNKWYEVCFEDKNGLIVLYTEKGEKIGVYVADFNKDIIIQR